MLEEEEGAGPEFDKTKNRIAHSQPFPNILDPKKSQRWSQWQARGVPEEGVGDTFDASRNDVVALTADRKILFR